jgi:S-adenosylmethionine hydrolase
MKICVERYADDTICHCVSLKQVEFIKRAIKKRFAECKLELNEEKTKIVYLDAHGEVFLNFSPSNQKENEDENMGNDL